MWDVTIMHPTSGPMEDILQHRWMHKVSIDSLRLTLDAVMPLVPKGGLQVPATKPEVDERVVKAIISHTVIPMCELVVHYSTPHEKLEEPIPAFCADGPFPTHVDMGQTAPYQTQHLAIVTHSTHYETQARCEPARLTVTKMVTVTSHAALPNHLDHYVAKRGTAARQRSNALRL
eukprot:5282239-Prymnesium_polylepis.1